MSEKIISAGFGGQGVMAIGQMLAYAGMLEGKQVSWYPAYGPEMRGGSANCNVVISERQIGSPVVTKADTLIAMNGPALDKFLTNVKKGGIILINSSLVERRLEEVNKRVYYIPATDIANELGNPKIANMVMIGAYVELTKLMTEETIRQAYVNVFGESKMKFYELNKLAMNKGAEFTKFNH
ncbi:MAG TPA: 2-oxoacid:ferredoxin oxidoreductase subunit gamma [Clostridiales bacterium]|nr:2-oxoacid:ferredoxin oxidoreductase subunit gamma [Clostridiales bacterium]